jgi:hypothetical protein
MRNCPRRAKPAVARDCDTELYAANAREKAIVCWPADVRPRCSSKVHSDGNARVRRRTLGNPAKCLPAFAAHLPAIQRSHMVTMAATKG